MEEAGRAKLEGAERLERATGGRGQPRQPLPLPSDGARVVVGDDADGDDGVEAATAALAALQLDSSAGEESSCPSSSSSSTSAAPSAGPASREKEEPSFASSGEWTDRSSVGMDVQAASEVWKLLVQLDVEGVHNTVLNALDSLTQGLLVATFLDRDVSTSGETTAAAAAGGAAQPLSSAPAAATGGAKNAEGGSGDSGGGGSGGGGSGSGGGIRDTKETEKEKAELRCILLGEQICGTPTWFGVSQFSVAGGRLELLSAVSWFFGAKGAGIVNAGDRVSRWWMRHSNVATVL